MTTTIKKILTHIRELREFIKQIYPTPESVVEKLTDAKYEEGIRVSKLVASQEVEVAMTPLMKNALEKYDKGLDRLKVNDPVTKAEKFINDKINMLLNKHWGPERSSYETIHDLNDRKLLEVDCWRNFKRNMRDIQPGQEDQRYENINAYYVPHNKVDVESLLENDKLFRLAVELVVNDIPYVYSAKDISQINLPFMSKHTNVSFPFWRNDRAVDPKTGLKYSELTLKIARETKLQDIVKYNCTTLYGRNQRGKGRHILAVSRIANLLLNPLEAEEIKAYKSKSSLFAGYNDKETLKLAMIKAQQYAISKGYWQYNFDQAKFDFHVDLGFILLIGAISMLKAKDNKGKQIAKYRTLLASQSSLVSGLHPEKLQDIIYGRIFSGFIDTNRGGGLINAIITTYCLLKMDDKYSKIHNGSPYPMFVMGDDNLQTYDPNKFNKDQYIKFMKELGYDINPEKGESGSFFLQYRLLKTGKGKSLRDYIITYPWTRVVKSMLFKESGKGLGPHGWTLAFWQQLDKLREDKLSLACALEVILPLDKEGLMLDKPVSAIIQGLVAEDKAIEHKTRNTSSAMKLYDGDPSKEGMFIKHQNGNIEFNDDYLHNLQKDLREGRDFLKNL